MSYIIKGLDTGPYRGFLSLSEEALAKQGMQIVKADSPTGYPCRASLNEAKVGERLLLLNYTHLARSGPYRASHAIFIGEATEKPAAFEGELPPSMIRRTLSIRAFDDKEMMLGARLVDGHQADRTVRKLLSRDDVSFLHIHYALRGCFAGLVKRD